MDSVSTPLTPREQEIFMLVGKGLDCREISYKLGITYFTVRKHRANITRKLKLHSAAQLSAYAVAAALERPEHITRVFPARN